MPATKKKTSGKEDKDAKFFSKMSAYLQNMKNSIVSKMPTLKNPFAKTVGKKKKTTSKRKK